jgi:CRISPR/Cas system endoribonuclease Cas6 (RAMP superfamily)
MFLLALELELSIKSDLLVRQLTHCDAYSTTTKLAKQNTVRQYRYLVFSKRVSPDTYTVQSMAALAWIIVSAAPEFIIRVYV